MENSFHLQSPMAQRTSQAATMAPTASMIDPNLENHRMSASPMPPDFETSQISPDVPLGRPSDRALPSMEVTDDSMDNAYVDFIMYCNPFIPADVDAAELRRGFRSPPKSDGKNFSPFVLYGLIRRLELKEIKTWTQLVTELGVELPDTTKNQSTQKVQQYAVRLKRWLRAFHVDAFFHYCLGIPNAYYADRPMTAELVPENARDGVPPEEDLALRALLPEWRPKRGRRKVEDNESENTPNKKTQFRRSASAEIFSAFEEPYSAQISSAATWSAHPQPPDAWTAAHMAIAPRPQSTAQTPSSGHLSAHTIGQQIRWRLNDRENASSTPYPQSAITPGQNYSASPSFEEPKSANPSSAAGKSPPSRVRKRHGPAVSSAWPASNTVTTGKLRGRPPSNRSVQDGPFSTFPATPFMIKTPAINVSTPIQATSPCPSRDSKDRILPNIEPATTNSPQPVMPEQSLVRRPSKLQLQVPEHSGGPVRLATPPRVLINGESNQVSWNHERRSSADFFNQIDDGSEEAFEEEVHEEGGNVDWRRRAMTLKRKLQEKEDELKAMKRRVLDAVM